MQQFWPQVNFGIRKRLLVFTFLLVVPLLTTLFMIGCSTPLTEYRPTKHFSNITDLDETTRVARAALRLTYQSFADSNPQRGSNYLLSTIEFTDQGQMWDVDQLDGTIDSINGYKALGVPITLIIFAHGWKNDASDYSGNFSNFRAFVTNFAQLFTNKVDGVYRTNGSQRVVVGVYLAWRGNTLEYDNPGLRWLATPLRQLSFYDRKNAAGLVSGVDFTRAILSLSSAVKFSSKTNDYQNDSKVIIIGHSFGGLIVERAVSEAMLGGMLINARRIERAKEDHYTLAAIYESNSTYYAKAANKCQQFVDSTNRPDYVRMFSITNAEEAKLTTVFDEKNKFISTEEHELNELEAGSLSEFNEPVLELWDSLTRIRWLSRNFGDLQRVVSIIFSSKNDIKLQEDDIQKAHDLYRKLEPHSFVNHLKVITNMLNEIDPRVKDYHDRLGEPHSPNYSGASAALAVVETNRNELANFLINPILIHYSTNQAILQIAKDGLAPIGVKLREAQQQRSKAEDAAGKSWDQTNNNINVFKTASKSYHFAAIQETNKAGAPLYDIGHPPADLILLANPASEALIARMLSEALESRLIKENTTLTNSDRPWVVSVSSKGDTATSFWFPLGRFFSGLSQSFRKDAASETLTEKGLYSHTAPQFPPMVSHKIERLTSRSSGTNTYSLLRVNINTNAPEFSIYTPHGEYTILSNTNSDCVNHSSYWVIQAPKELIPDHGAIFTPDFLGIATALYRISQRGVLNSPPASTPLKSVMPTK